MFFPFLSSSSSPSSTLGICMFYRVVCNVYIHLECVCNVILSDVWMCSAHTHTHTLLPHLYWLTSFSFALLFTSTHCPSFTHTIHLCFPPISLVNVCSCTILYQKKLLFAACFSMMWRGGSAFMWRERGEETARERE